MKDTYIKMDSPLTSDSRTKWEMHIFYFIEWKGGVGSSASKSLRNAVLDANEH